MLLVLAALGCAEEDDPGPDDGQPGTAEPGYLIQTLIHGLPGPTQLAWHPDGRLLIALLGEGGEGSETGRIVAVDLSSAATEGGTRRPEPDVLVDGLDTPTGLAVAGDTLWIMERTRLVTAPLAGGATTIVRDDLPTNGRSNGSLTVLADGRLLFDTSGRQTDGVAEEGSGVLWSLDPTDPEAAELPALVGMKHAYATAEDGRGGLLVTEIGDGRYDGERPPDEVVALPDLDAADAPVADGGWPQCIGDRLPVAEHGGTPERCADTLRSLTLFEPSATPTGIAVAPWDDTRAVVALWVPGDLVEIPIEPGPGPDDAPVGGTVIAAGLDGPQHLLADRWQLLVSAHRQGAILAVNGSKQEG